MRGSKEWQNDSKWVDGGAYDPLKKNRRIDGILVEGHAPLDVSEVGCFTIYLAGTFHDDTHVRGCTEGKEAVGSGLAGVMDLFGRLDRRLLYTSTVCGQQNQRTSIHFSVVSFGCSLLCYSTHFCLCRLVSV